MRSILGDLHRRRAYLDVNNILHGLFTLLPSTFRLALLCTLATNHGDPSWFDPLLAKCRLRVDFD